MRDFRTTFILSFALLLLGFLANGQSAVFLSGRVFADGNANTLFETGEGLPPISTPLYVYAVQTSTGIMRGSGQVQADGTYATSNLAFPSSYTLVLSRYVYATNTHIDDIVPSIPDGWLTTGENGDSNTGSGDGVPDGRLVVSGSSRTNKNFGIHRPPVTDDDTGSGLIGMSVTVDVLNNDEDPDASGGLRADRVSLIAPSGADDVVSDSDEDIVSMSIPDEGVWSVDLLTGEITFTPESGFTRNPTPIQYTVLDLPGALSNPASVTITYNKLTITGTVFNDANGNTLLNGVETFDGPAEQLYVYLVDSNGDVVGATPVNSDGSYLLEAAPNQLYTLQLSVGVYLLGTSTTSTPIDTALPAGWMTTGENGDGNVGAGDGVPDGVLAVSVGIDDVSSQNFGINSLPDTDLVYYELPYQPVPNQWLFLDNTDAPLMTGFDEEDGTYAGNEGTVNNPRGVVITSMPTNGELWYYVDLQARLL